MTSRKTCLVTEDISTKQSCHRSGSALYILFIILINIKESSFPLAYIDIFLLCLKFILYIRSKIIFIFNC